MLAMRREYDLQNTQISNTAQEASDDATYDKNKH